VSKMQLKASTFPQLGEKSNFHPIYNRPVASSNSREHSTSQETPTASISAPSNSSNVVPSKFITPIRLAYCPIAFIQTIYPYLVPPVLGMPPRFGPAFRYLRAAHYRNKNAVS